MTDAIEDAAARWAVRHPLSPEDADKMDAWLKQDRRHAGALLRARAGLSRINDGLVSARRDAGMPGAQRVTIDRRWMLAGAGGAIAATIAAVVGVRIPGEERIATAHGEIRRLPLEDGSEAVVDSDTDLRIAMSEGARRIKLREGQAFFRVAKDRKRPFTVEVEGVEARAIGTAFSVSRTPDEVRVQVTEGVVETWANETSTSSKLLYAGQFAIFRKSDAAPVIGSAPDRIEQSLAWRDGEIWLENDTLAYAVQQFNRYNRRQLVLGEESLANERLVGVFKLSRPELFADVLAESLEVAVSTKDRQITLFRKNKSSDR
ncbi:FecR family protein [Sphingomonas sp. ac-8]|uniref:FecR family protein n=1 Tax=Sphingomonas sp. ac-8 TaxID=3242977 RepID=UPI003A7FB5CA